jgi:streptomycin 6-kinase
MICAVHPRPVEVPVLVRQRAARLGEAGHEWLAGLPDLLADLQRRWSITVGRPLPGGSASYVARARTADGSAAVLKVALPDGGTAAQARTLALADGRGYARLLAHDAERHALLLEALGPSLAERGLGPERTIEALCATLRLAWQVPLPDGGSTATPAGAKAGQLAHLVTRLWEDHGRPCPERVVAAALACAERRAAAFDPDRCVVVHGDPHPGNALRVAAPRAGAESGFVFVDPDGFVDDPAYDLGVVLRDWCPQLLAGDAVSLARRYCRLLAECTGVDETAIWEWGLLERVSTGLYVLDVGAADRARPFLDTAALLA